MEQPSTTRIDKPWRERRSSLIRLVDVHKSYSMGELDVPVLRGVDLEIEKGEFVLMFGPSGSGKTTLLNLIAGIDRPDSGKVIVGGEEVSAMSDRALTRFRRVTLGYIFQFYNLIPTLTAAENISLALELLGRHDPDAVQEALERVGLGEKGHRFPAQLSGGEQQRVAIARSVVKRPLIVAGDEPTGNLDLATSRDMLALLKSLNAEGETVLIATHDSTLANGHGRVIHLEEGRIRSD